MEGRRRHSRTARGLIEWVDASSLTEISMPKEESVDRRAFMRSVAGAAMGAPLAVCGAATTGEASQPGCRRLGRTGLDVSIISLGGHAAYRPYVVTEAIERGISLVHTAPFYCRGAGMAALASVFKHLRSKVCLVVKIYPDAKMVDRALQVMQTDHIDIVMPGIQSLAALKRGGLVEDFEKRKKEGKVRFLGMACHSSIPKVVGKALEMDCFDAIMMSYNLANRQEVEPLLAEAAKRDVGIIGMKSWRTADPENSTRSKPKEAAETLAELLRETRVATILRGIECMEDVDAFTALLHQKVGRLEPRTHGLERTVAAGVCSMCGACEPCPAGVRVQDILRYVQYAADRNAAHTEYAPEAYARLRPGRSFDACRSCAACEAACPKGLNVRQQLAQAHAILTGDKAKA